MSTRAKTGSSGERGAIAWMARVRVPANLMMIVLILGGLMMSSRIKQEVFPEFSEDMVTVTVMYPGASPEEVERGIILAIEDNIRSLEGIHEVTSTATEGFASIVAEISTGENPDTIYQRIKQEVDRVTTLPEDAERPDISLMVHRREVLQLVIYGDADDVVLRDLAERSRQILLSSSEITQVDVSPSLRREIAVEIPEERLRALGTSVGALAQTIGKAAIELPGGRVRTASGDVMLRVTERRDEVDEISALPLIATPDGAQLRVDQVANVFEGFEETNSENTYNGKPCAELEVYRVGDQTPLRIAALVRELLPEVERALPAGVNVVIDRDMSEVYADRLGLLLRNAGIGLVLVLIILGLFLELRLAFWVTLGIPTSFLGALLFLPGFDVSINMISMFGFIIALGIVVDDAIVAGENIYEMRQRGAGFLEAAIAGAKGVAIPITFSVLTNIVAFMPLMFVPGFMGKIFKTIPLVVATVFAISWVEALFILPAHLSHGKNGGQGFTTWLSRRFGGWLARFIDGAYTPLLEASLRRRYLTLAVAVAILVGTVGYAASGRLGFVLMPRQESDYAVATATLPGGSPIDRARAVRDKMVAAAERVAAEHGGDALVEGIIARLNGDSVMIFIPLTDPEVRPIPTRDFTRLWREATGPIPGLESLLFESDRGGPGGGRGLTVELQHEDVPTLEAAARTLGERMLEIQGVQDLDDGVADGKSQFDFTLRPEARRVGLTASDIARQVRGSFYGAEALRVQRGRDELRVMVRLPLEQRSTVHDVESLILRTPSGGEVPLRQVAEVERGRAYTSIRRHDGRRSLTVRANVIPYDATSRVTASLRRELLPELIEETPGLSYSFEGHQNEMRESMGALQTGFVLAMLVIYAMLAIPLKSYTQPLIVMTAIPFGAVGAVFGHLIMGYSLSIISMMGLVALSGVVINDALVLLDTTNRRREEGLSAHDAVRSAARRRFRPILLTTLTTFGGLAPMIFEQSFQARMMIPMALSLGFGIVFATGIILLLVPSLYLVLEDLHAIPRLLLARFRLPATAPTTH